MLGTPMRRGIVAALFLVAAVVGTAGAASASAAAPYCGITWGSLPKANETMSSAALIDVRTGQHACFDRVVFDFNGTATGYRVSYQDHVYSEGRGDELRIAGGAKLRVTLLEPAYDIDTGTPTYPPPFADPSLSVAGFRTLRQVVDGGSFEGYTTYGIGVRARLPFRVFTLAGPGGHSRIVLDVAHRWS